LNASVSAAVGFISLFGVAAMDGILLMSYIRRELAEGADTETAVIRAGEARMRQVFMTGFSACIGLVPAAISTGIGSQVQQPLACVIVGGMLLSPICSLLVIPTIARLALPNFPRTEADASKAEAPEPA
jgi:cobalt-zinc-cadmium resistance protein CzcA